MNDERAPLTPVERVLVQFIEDLLSAENVSPSDDFLAIGGASLAAIQLTLKIEEHFQIDFPLMQIFDARTVGELAELIERAINGRKRYGA